MREGNCRMRKGSFDMRKGNCPMRKGFFDMSKGSFNVREGICDITIIINPYNEGGVDIFPISVQMFAG